MYSPAAHSRSQIALDFLVSTADSFGAIAAIDQSRGYTQDHCGSEFGFDTVQISKENTDQSKLPACRVLKTHAQKSPLTVTGSVGF
jgi:hypothetical protein